VESAAPGAWVVEAEDLDRVVPALGAGSYTVRQLHARITILEPRIVVWQEIPDGTVETLAIMGQRMEELGQGFDRFCLLVDLADAKRGSTTAAYREAIPRYFNSLKRRLDGRLRHIAVAFEHNLVARTVTQFLIGRMVDVPISVHKNRALAIAVIHEALA
jgi:hypothetical protein